MKRAILTLLLLASTLLISGCSSDPKPPESPPDIKVTADSRELVWSAGINQWNGAIVDRSPVFWPLVREQDFDKIPYLPFDTIIEIEFSEYLPDEIELWDIILNMEGEPRYSEEVHQIVDIDREDGKIRFVLEFNMAAMLSSNSADYEPGAVLRGFRLDCTWEDGNDCEYGFVLRTDAG